MSCLLNGYVPVLGVFSSKQRVNNGVEYLNYHFLRVALEAIARTAQNEKERLS